MVLGYGVYIKRNLASEGDVKRFFGKFGELFEEFRFRNQSDWLYYVFYVFRRIFLAFIVLFFKVSVLQLAVSIVMTLSVRVM